MNTITVHNEVREYPDEPTQSYQTLIISNHWSNPRQVVLEIKGERYVFVAAHLRQAIDNAVNAH